MIAKIVIAIMICFNVALVFKAFMIAIPMKATITHKEKNVMALQEVFGINEKMANAFYNAGIITELNPVLIACLAYTESNFKLDAKSYAYPDKYKGIMQTRNVDYDADIDIMRGAKHLRRNYDRVQNMQKALALYKGGDNPVAHKQAKRVLDLYKEKKVEINTYVERIK